ncbi:hypothetical protein [Gordoniibacillus kamchatkensis]|uniref:hypothetical protein n=1 Tax=Gordoniibacillus kamchatkensis TaxID=1590651 RepID=UPI000A77E8A3|nr:hypothetical protein [Paenibacillus sp. VKM B-2647]
MKDHQTNAEAAELGTLQNGAVGMHKTRKTAARTVGQPFPPGVTDPRTAKRT